MTKSLLILLLITFYGCNSVIQKEEEEEKEEIVEIQEDYDGFYPAWVEYYNPNTNNYKDYHVNVEISNSTIIAIYFENGKIFTVYSLSQVPINDDGYGEVITDDGVKFRIHIAVPPDENIKDNLDLGLDLDLGQDLDLGLDLDLRLELD